MAAAHEGLAQAAAATAHDDPSQDTAHTNSTLNVPSRSAILPRISPCVNSHSYRVKQSELAVWRLMGGLPQSAVS